MGGNGSGSRKSAWEEGGRRETEAARSEAPPRRVRLRREKDGKETETGVYEEPAVGATRRTTATARRPWRMGGGHGAMIGTGQLEGEGVAELVRGNKSADVQQKAQREGSSFLFLFFYCLIEAHFF